MQLAGDEKRIQALFCELSREDQGITPRFEKLWNCAKTMNPEPVRSFSRSLVMIATGLAVAMVCSSALWLRSRSVEPVNSVEKKTETISSSEQKIVLSIVPKKQKRVIRQRKSKPAVINEAMTLSSWQSPTEILMESSSSAILKTSLQLNQSLRELESFLPNEVKETKQ